MWLVWSRLKILLSRTRESHGTVTWLFLNQNFCPLPAHLHNWYAMVLYSLTAEQPSTRCTVIYGFYTAVNISDPFHHNHNSDQAHACVSLLSTCSVYSTNVSSVLNIKIFIKVLFGGRRSCRRGPGWPGIKLSPKSRDRSPHGRRAAARWTGAGLISWGYWLELTPRTDVL